MRVTLGMIRQSMFPQAVGLCADDLPGIAARVNRATQQLVNAGGETGFWGGWQKVILQASLCHPYVTMARQFARIIELAVCRAPIRIQNEFYELLPDSIGPQDFCRIGGARNWCGAMAGYERGVWPVMRDLDPANQLLRVILTDPRDVGRRILIGPAQDQNGNPIYSQDGNNPVNGFYLALAQPWTTSAFIVTAFSGIQKDPTYGDVLLYQVDATTGAQVLLSRYAPDEVAPAYRRYYFNNLPCSCNTSTLAQSPCITGIVPAGTVQMTAIAKLEFIPVNRDTDFNLIGNIPALIEEGKAIRYSDMDVPNAAQLEAKSHGKAMRLLNDELRHYLGEVNPAVVVSPFGTARLEHQRIGSLT